MLGLRIKADTIQKPSTTHSAPHTAHRTRKTVHICLTNTAFIDVLWPSSSSDTAPHSNAHMYVPYTHTPHYLSTCSTRLQKNPSTIRQPEEDRGWENYTMTARVNLDRSATISPHIKPLCAEAKDNTFVRDVDLKALAELPGKIFACTLRHHTAYYMRITHII